MSSFDCGKKLGKDSFPFTNKEMVSGLIKNWKNLPSNIQNNFNPSDVKKMTRDRLCLFFNTKKSAFQNARSLKTLIKKRIVLTKNKATVKKTKRSNTSSKKKTAKKTKTTKSKTTKSKGKRKATKSKTSKTKKVKKSKTAPKKKMPTELPLDDFIAVTAAKENTIEEAAKTELQKAALRIIRELKKADDIEAALATILKFAEGMPETDLQKRLLERIARYDEGKFASELYRTIEVLEKRNGLNIRRPRSFKIAAVIDFFLSELIRLSEADAARGENPTSITPQNIFNALEKNQDIGRAFVGFSTAELKASKK